MELFVRDDGSTDGSIDILRSYADRWPALANIAQVEIFAQPRAFWSSSDRSQLTSTTTRFAIRTMSGSPENSSRRGDVGELRGIPDLYCSLATCVDNELKPLGPLSFRGAGDFEHLMFASIVLGATAVMNKSAANLVRSRTPGSAVIMHDWWCALVVSAFGTIVADPRKTMLYRQHQGNAKGTAPGRIAGLIVQSKAFLRNPKAFYPIHGQVSEFLTLRGPAGPAER